VISDDEELRKLSDYFIKIPSIYYLVYPLLTVVVGQLLAYYTADIL
jgi:glucosamine 6-phosphate synthetase-like amidotransferase/phosphosugar isomerase protein